MRVVVACEESGAVREAFRRKGHIVTSVDLMPASDGSPFHVQGDIKHYLDFAFRKEYRIDLLIAFPPCTHLASSGARWFKQKQEDGRQQEGIEFFKWFTEHTEHIPKVCIENPIGIMSKLYRKPDQIVQPWMFGEEYQKSTCLWLKGLPLLTPTKVVDKGEWITFPSGKRMQRWYSEAKKGTQHSIERSKTPQGLAEAMAQQWGYL